MPFACPTFFGADHVVLEEISSAAFPAEVTKTVSVIIPTRNAGPGFSGLLQAIRKQRKVADVEILVLDSASDDDTIAVAEAHGARVQQVNPAEFSHGGTRNRGASMARGEYLVFLVQDAMPLNAYWLYRLTAPLEADPELMALCTRQIMPPGAECFLAEWTNRELTGTIYAPELGDYAITAEYSDAWWEQLSDAQKRRLPFFDDVCSCVRADFFRGEPFREMVNAEDIEYGFRLLRKGCKRGFINSTGVLHFHDRGPDHQLKTSYLGGIALSELLGIGFYPVWQAMEASLEQLQNLFVRQLHMADKVLRARQAAEEGGSCTGTHDVWEETYEEFCSSCYSPTLTPVEAQLGGCSEMVALRRMLHALFTENGEDARADTVNVPSLLSLTLQNFWRPYYQPLLELGRKDQNAFRTAFSGLLGRFWGMHLACFVLWNPAMPEAEAINNLLEEGICRADGARSTLRGPSLAERLSCDRRQTIQLLAQEAMLSQNTLDNFALLMKQFAPLLGKMTSYLDSLLDVDKESPNLSLPRKRVEELRNTVEVLARSSTQLNQKMHI